MLRRGDTGSSEPDRTLPDVLVLCYHGVSEAWPAATAVRPGQLRAQLEFLLNRGYRGATFSEALIAPAAAKTLAVTFDDAHRSVLTHAQPILASLGVPATVFVPTDYPDSGARFAWEGVDQWMGGPFEAELACMSWAEIRQLADAGWEMGSHTRSHPHLTQLDDERLEDELRGSREVLEQQLERACPTLAYPYSDCDRRVVKAAWSAGYRLAATVSPHYDPPLPLQWPRVDVSRDDEPSRFRWRVSPTTRRMALSPVWRPLLDGARAAKGRGRRALASAGPRATAGESQ